MRIEKNTIQNNIVKKAEAFSSLYDAIDQLIENNKWDGKDVPVWELEELINVFSEVYEGKKQ